jgi:Arc/MetJ-type ribon-helix-helix transcriptional regulator
MNVSLSARTEELLQARLKRGGYADADEVLRLALETLEQVEGEPIEDLDADTQSAIARAEGQADRGEGRAWEDVRQELRARFKQG